MLKLQYYVTVMLFPAEDPESDEVDGYEPEGHYAQLRAELPQVLALGGD